MKSQIEEKINESMVKNPRNWKGMVYFNKMDPRLIVRKYDPLRGWTFNFSSPYSYITLVAIILIVILSALVFKFI